LKKFHKLLLPVSLLLVLLLVFALYQPGLHGGFLFDDYPNLEELGSYGGITNYETFKNFVFNGISSPLGRPLALATFLLDDNTWPSHAEWFKTTNLKIHILTGLFLCWASLHLMRLYGKHEATAAWIALLSASIWMLHPYMVSTTLYVVQRMAQLAAMFVFMGLAGYLYGRCLLSSNRVSSAYVWMSASLGIATVLALLSKENGVLLPLMVAAIEFCLPKNLPKLKLWWMLIFIGLPGLAIFALLAKEINFSPDAWPGRPFTQPERLLTEPRIVCEYLFHLYVPRIEGRGLFQDGYNFSRSLFEPISTLFCILGLALLFVAALYLRRRTPLFSLSILFFFASHLLESTVVGLELYFEHRNYLSSAFLFLPLSAWLVRFYEKDKKIVAVVGALLIILALSFLTWKRVNIWSNTRQLEMYWAASTPESPRAQNKIGSILLNIGKLDESIAHMDKAVDRFPQSSLLVINNILIKVYAGRATESDFMNVAEMIKTQPFDAQSVMGLRNLAEKVSDPHADETYRVFVLAILDATSENKNYNSVYSFQKLVPYLKGLIYLSMKDYDQSFKKFNQAIAMYSETDAALSMVAIMANADRPVEAFMLFKQAESVFEAQPDKTLKRSRALYNSEFKRLGAILEENLKTTGIGSIEVIKNPEVVK
jgi:tetratricopeptide (TPR) repeat protein